MKGHGTCKVAHRADNRNARGYESPMRLEEIIFTINVKAQVETGRIVHGFALGERAQGESKAVFVEKNDKTVVTAEDLLEAEVLLKELSSDPGISYGKIKMIEIHAISPTSFGNAAYRRCM